MGTAYIPATIAAEEGGVFLFETECLCEVDYTIDANELEGWRVTDFKFEQYRYYRPDYPNGEVKRVKVGEAWCPDFLRPVLMHYLNEDALESALLDYLFESGELRYSNDELRRDYHSGVL